MHGPDNVKFDLLASTLDEAEWQASLAGTFTPRKKKRQIMNTMQGESQRGTDTLVVKKNILPLRALWQRSCDRPARSHVTAPISLDSTAK